MADQINERIGLSSLGRTLPKCLVTGQEVLVAVKAFLDSSGELQKSDIVVLAGVAATEGVWQGFETKWDEVLKARDPIAPYLHMKELIKGRGPFSNENGWDDVKRQQLLTDCVMYVQHLDKNLFRTFICSIDMVRYRELEADDSLILPPAIDMLNYYVPTQIFKWFTGQINTLILREMYYHFDQNEPFLGPYSDLIRRKKKLSRISNAWHMVRPPIPTEMATTPQIQLADLIAWGHHRRLNSVETDKWWSIHKFTDAVLPFTRMDITRAFLDKLAFQYQQVPMPFLPPMKVSSTSTGFPRCPPIW